MGVSRVFLEQRIAVKQLVLHIDTWYTSRGVGKEQLSIAKIEAAANAVCGLWQVQDRASCSHFLAKNKLLKINLGKTTCSKR